MLARRAWRRKEIGRRWSAGSEDGCRGSVACLLIAAVFLGVGRCVAVRWRLSGSNGGEAGAEAFKGIMPECFSGERFKAKDFAGARGENSVVLNEDVDEIPAF